MKTKLKVSLIFFLMSFIASAQDIIYKNDRTEVKAKIVEVQENDIKYKKFDFLDGPIYTMSKSEIYMIIYKNGQKEIFENKKTVEAINKQKENNTSTNVSTTKTDATQNKVSSEYTIKKRSFGVSDLGFTLNNFSDYDIPNIVSTNDIIIKDNIALQTYVSFNSSSSQSSAGGITIKSDAFNNLIGIGGKYYLNEVLKLDTEKFHVYGGATIGYSMTSVSISSNSSLFPSSSSSKNELTFFAQIGGRYFLNKHWGVKTEFQFGKGDSTIQVGLSYRLQPKIK